MNAGPDYKKAKLHAKQNAISDGKPRWLHSYGGVYWISKTPIADAEKIESKTPA